MSDDPDARTNKNRFAIVVLSFIFVVPFFIVIGHIAYEMLHFEGECWSIPGEVITYSCSIKEYAYLKIFSPFAIGMYGATIGLWVLASTVFVIIVYLVRQIIGFFKNLVVEIRHPTTRCSRQAGDNMVEG
jgi:hypothetical protein